MESRHRVWVRLEPPAVYSLVIADLWWPEVVRPETFVSNWFFCVLFVFILEKRPIGKNFQIRFREFSPPHRSALFCSNVVKFVRRKIDEIVRYLPHKKFRLPLKLSLLRGSRPKCASVSPPNICSQRSKFHPNQFTFGGCIAERVNTFWPNGVITW